MTFRDFTERYKGVRRTVLAFCVLWTSATVGTGLYVMLARELSAADTGFLTAVVALMNVPIAFYFHSRGKE
jgi:hypothetical protein